MQKPKFSEYEMLMLNSDNPIATSIFLILSWLAVSDGVIDESESQAISEIANQAGYKGDIQPIIRIARKRDITAIQLASEIIKSHITDKQNAKMFIMMSIRVVVADGYLLPSENHILRFLADVLDLTKIDFDDIFREATGRDVPDAQDISTAEYWASQGYTNRNSREHTDTDSPRQRKVSKFHAVLGLEANATQEEIRSAYRRLAMANHPDKFASLGKEAQAVAEENMKRINEAYRNLKHA